MEKKPSELLLSAIYNLDEEDGSSFEDIVSFISDNCELREEAVGQRINDAILRALECNILTKIKNKYLITRIKKDYPDNKVVELQNFHGISFTDGISNEMKQGFASKSGDLGLFEADKDIKYRSTHKNEESLDAFIFNHCHPTEKNRANCIIEQTEPSNTNINKEVETPQKSSVSAVGYVAGLNFLSSELKEFKKTWKYWIWVIIVAVMMVIFMVVLFIRAQEKKCACLTLN